LRLKVAPLLRDNGFQNKRNCRRGHNLSGCRVARRIRFRHALSSRAQHRANGCKVAENQSDILGHFGAPPQNEREFVVAPGNALVSKERAASCDRKVTNTPVNACKAIRFADGRKNRMKKYDRSVRTICAKL